MIERQYFTEPLRKNKMIFVLSAKHIPSKSPFKFHVGVPPLRVARTSSDDVLNLLMKRNRRVVANVEGEKRSRNTDRAQENRLELVSLPKWIYLRRVEVDFNARKAMSNRNAFSINTEFSISDLSEHFKINILNILKL